MARTIKEGFTYFPLDTDSFENRKIRRLLLSQGCQAYAVWVVTMQMIFGEKGYYLHLDEDVCFDIGDKVAVSEGAVKEILTTCIQVDLFNKQMFDKFGILTSKGIQKQFEEMVKVTKRKTTIDPKYKINPEEMTVRRNKLGRNDSPSVIYSEETPIYSEEMQQSKVKESKVKENKINKNTTANNKSYINNSADVFQDDLDEKQQAVAGVLQFYQNNFGLLSSYIQEDLIQWCEDLSPELTRKAMEIAIENQRNYAYAKGILRSWLTKQIKTLADVEAEQVQFQQQKQRQQYKKTHKNEVVPDYMTKQTDSTTSNLNHPNTEDVPSLEELQASLSALVNTKEGDNDRN